MLGGEGAFESQGLTASSAGVRPGQAEVISSISVRGSSAGARAIVLVNTSSLVRVQTNTAKTGTGERLMMAIGAG